MPMKFIGITGGVGSGKSLIMDYLREKPRTAVLYSDRFAEEMEQPGQAAYEKIRAAFPDESLYQKDGTMDRRAFGSLVFSDRKNLERLNAIIHPAIKEAILKDVDEKRQSGRYDFYFLEAALLIECGYTSVCDEIWVVSASEDVRRRRLAESRGYSAEKMDAMLLSQASEEAFAAHADSIIHNDGTPEDAFRQVDALLEREILTSHSECLPSAGRQQKNR